jgi:hypothetical protein
VSPSDGASIHGAPSSGAPAHRDDLFIVSLPAIASAASVAATEAAAATRTATATRAGLILGFVYTQLTASHVVTV